MRSRCEKISNYSPASHGGIYLCFNSSAFLRSEVSHSIRSTAISQVSRSTVGSVLSSLIVLIMSKLQVSPNAPSASAASCLHIASSVLSSRTVRKYGTAPIFLVCPRQYANSCLSSAEGDVNAAAIASIAAVVRAEGDWHARCFSEKSARNRRARGTVSDVRAFRSASTVVPATGEGSPDFVSMAEGDIAPADVQCNSSFQADEQEFSKVSRSWRK
jgi:hypothetical protein